MKRLILLIVLSLLIIIGLIGIFYTNKYKPVVLINSNFVIIARTTNGARARITELESNGKSINEIIDVLEEEGYIKEIDDESKGLQ